MSASAKHRFFVATMLAAFVLAVIVLVAGCTPPSGVVTSERPTRLFTVTVGNGMYNSWFADGPPTVLTVHNYTAQRVQVQVVCNPTTHYGYIDAGHHEWWLCLDPGQERRRFVEFLNIDALRRPVCTPRSWPSKEPCIDTTEW